MGVSERGDPNYSTLNGRILILRTPQSKVPLMFGNPHVSSDLQAERRILEMAGEADFTVLL